MHVWLECATRTWLAIGKAANIGKCPPAARMLLIFAIGTVVARHDELAGALLVDPFAGVFPAEWAGGGDAAEGTPRRATPSESGEAREPRGLLRRRRASLVWRRVRRASR